MSTETSQTIAAGQLRAFIERIERLEAEIKELNADKSEIYKELRGCGFDVKAVRKCVSKRKLDDADRVEQDAIFDLYWEALTGASRVHVHEETQKSDGGAIAAVTVKDQLAEADSLEPSPSDNSPGPLHSAASGGKPSIPSSEAGGAKMDEAPTSPDRAAQAAVTIANSEQAATVSQSSQSTSSPSATTAGEAAHPPASPAPITAMTAKTKADVMRLLRPRCQHPDDLDRCGGQGTRHCSACLKAAAESEAVA